MFDFPNMHSEVPTDAPKAACKHCDGKKCTRGQMFPQWVVHGFNLAPAGSCEEMERYSRQTELWLGWGFGIILPLIGGIGVMTIVLRTDMPIFVRAVCIATSLFFFYVAGRTFYGLHKDIFDLPGFEHVYCPPVPPPEVTAIPAGGGGSGAVATILTGYTAPSLASI